MKCKLTVLLFACALVTGAFSQVLSQPDALERLVGGENAASLKANGDTIVETQLKNPNLKLIPNHSGLRRFIAEAEASLAPNLAVETLYLYKKPLIQGKTAGNWSDAQRKNLFNQLIALSTLTGIQYYSASRSAMRTFYEFSMVIDSPDKKNTLPDPVFGQVPEKLTLFARQKDLTFGENIYRYEFNAAADAIIFSQENITSLNYGLITAVGKNKLRSIFAVIDCGDSLLIYAASMAKAAFVFGMGERIGNSFGNRAEAVLKWFSDRAEGVFSTE